MSDPESLPLPDDATAAWRAAICGKVATECGIGVVDARMGDNGRAQVQLADGVWCDAQALLDEARRIA